MVGAATGDLNGRKARLWWCRVFGWEAGLCSVALLSARLKRLRHWRGSTSALASAASLHSLPSLPSIPSIWSHQHHHYHHHYQCHYQHHYQYHYQHRDHPSLQGHQNPHFAEHHEGGGYFGYNGAPDRRWRGECRLLRSRLFQLGGVGHLIRSRHCRCQRVNGFLGSSRWAIPWAWRCLARARPFWSPNRNLWGSGGKRGLEDHDPCFARCRVANHFPCRCSLSPPWPVWLTWVPGRLVMAPGPVTVDATMACCYRGGGLHDKVCQERWWKDGCLNQLQKC